MINAKRPARSWLIIGIVVGLLAHATGSRADVDPLAKPTLVAAQAHLGRGNKLYALREFEQAIEEYKAGALVEDAPVFQYNLAQAYRLSGHHKEALWHYDRFVKRTRPTGPLRDAISQFVAELNRDLERAARAQRATQPAARETQPALSAAPAAIPDRSRSRPRRWYHDNLGWALTGGGAALVLSSVGLLLSARSIDDDAQQTSQESKRSSLRDRAQTRRIFGYLAGGVGVPLLVIGGVRLALVSDGERAVVAMRTRF